MGPTLVIPLLYTEFGNLTTGYKKALLVASRLVPSSPSFLLDAGSLSSGRPACATSADRRSCSFRTRRRYIQPRPEVDASFAQHGRQVPLRRLQLPQLRRCHHCTQLSLGPRLRAPGLAEQPSYCLPRGSSGRTLGTT